MTSESIITLPIFDGLTPAEFDNIAAGLKEMTYPASEVIVREGEDTNTPLFFAWLGEVKVLKHAGGDSERELANLIAPTIFGELELITNIPFSATLKATTNTKAYVMTRTSFHDMREAGDSGLMKMIYNISKIMAMRLYHTNKALSEATGPTNAQIEELRKTSLTWVL